MPVIECRDLSIRRGGRTILELPSFALSYGETVAIMGANGSGKSTFLQVLNGIISPWQGTVTIAGKAIGVGSRYLEVRRKMAAIYQDPLLLDASVSDNVAIGMKFRGLQKEIIAERVDYWLERLGIGHLRDRWARGLSGGEGQRVSLARALACAPEILILDEPFASLDPPTKAGLVSVLKKIFLEQSGEEKPMATLLVSHSFEEVLALADRLVMIWEGRMLDLGHPREARLKNLQPAIKVFFGHLHELE